MMSRTTAGAWLSIAMVSLTAGCSEEVPPCAAIQGQFNAVYQYIQGSGQPVPGYSDCPIGPYAVPVSGGNYGNQITTVQQPDKNVVLDVRITGCSIGMDVKVEKKTGQPMAIIRGDVSMLSNDQLGGTVQGTAYDSAGNQACYGLYNAVLTRTNAAAVGSPAIQTGMSMGTAGMGGGVVENPRPPIPGGS